MSRQSYQPIHTSVKSTDEIVVTKGATEFILVANADDTWSVDFYSPRVDTASNEYNAMWTFCNRQGLQYEYLKESSQMWITGELHLVLRLLTIPSIKEEWSQYYKEE